MYKFVAREEGCGLGALLPDAFGRNLELVNDCVELDLIRRLKLEPGWEVTAAGLLRTVTLYYDKWPDFVLQASEEAKNKYSIKLANKDGLFYRNNALR